MGKKNKTKGKKKSAETKYHGVFVRPRYVHGLITQMSTKDAKIEELTSNLSNANETFNKLRKVNAEKENIIMGKIKLLEEKQDELDEGKERMEKLEVAVEQRIVYLLLMKTKAPKNVEATSYLNTFLAICQYTQGWINEYTNIHMPVASPGNDNTPEPRMYSQEPHSW